ncbi:MAG: DUF4870 domain-containing protein [Actinomycetota bacterium]|nr:DUF4870 domain-containing protein [Actinomycetota bacterium]
MVKEEEQKKTVAKTNYDDEAKKENTSDNKATIILSYLGSWLGGLIVYLLEKQNRFIKWHALQALILGVFEVACIIIISSLLGMIPYVGWYFFSWFDSLMAGVAWILGIVALIMGCNGKTFKIPGASQLADKWFKI